MVALIVVFAAVGIVGLLSAYAFNVGGFRTWVDNYQRQYSQPGNIPPPYGIR